MTVHIALDKEFNSDSILLDMLKHLKKYIGLKIALFVSAALLFVMATLMLVLGQFRTSIITPENIIPFCSLFALIFIFLQVVLVFLGIGLFIGKPLQAIMSSMKRISEGHLTEECELNTQDEFGELSQNFNKMMTSVRHMHESRQNIEKRLVVAEEGLKYKTALADKAKIIERMNQELATALGDISLLYTVSQHLSSVLVMGDLVHKVRTIFEDKFKCDGFALYFLDESTHHLDLVAYKNLKNITEDQKHIDSEEGMAGYVVKKNRSVYEPDMSQYESSLLSFLEKQYEGAVFTVALRVHDDVIGVLSVWRKNKDSFTPTDRQSLESIGSQIAIAFDRSLLYTKTKELSVRDELTNAYNRRYFYQMLRREFERAKRFNRTLSLLMIDLDHFKGLNDTYGHLVGDQILKHFTDLLQKNIREIDVLARFGGEEFVVLLSDTELKNAVIVAEKLLNIVRGHPWDVLVAKKLNQEDFNLKPITISVGVSAYPEKVSSQEELIHMADVALYQAKSQGRDQVKVAKDSLKGSVVSIHKINER